MTARIGRVTVGKGQPLFARRVFSQWTSMSVAQLLVLRFCLSWLTVR